MTHVNLSIKDVPEALAQRLRERAALNHRSLQGELMAIIEQAAHDPEGTSAQPAAAATARTSTSTSTSIGAGKRRIEDIAREHRLRFPRAIAVGPMAVDIVRADRDSR